MPQPAESHRDQQVTVRLPTTISRATKRYEQIVAQPGGKRNVPAMPEIGNVFCNVWQIEIDRYVIAEKHGRTAGDVRVS